LKITLTERVLEAASNMVDELRADPGTKSDDLKIVGELVDTAAAFLRELRDHPV